MVFKAPFQIKERASYQLVRTVADSPVIPWMRAQRPLWQFGQGALEQPVAASAHVQVETVGDSTVLWVLQHFVSGMTWEAAYCDLSENHVPHLWHGTLLHVPQCFWDDWYKVPAADKVKESPTDSDTTTGISGLTQGAKTIFSFMDLI